MMLVVGDEAPDFDLPAGGGRRVVLSRLRGHKVVVYFYPKDLTPGCVAEAKAFRDAKADFDAVDAQIVGISRDPAERHDKFIAQHSLNFLLASDDEDGSVCAAYGVWAQKSMFGRAYMGIERATYLIDAQGCIAQIWRKVKVKGHAAEVLKAAQSL